MKLTVIEQNWSHVDTYESINGAEKRLTWLIMASDNHTISRTLNDKDSGDTDGDLKQTLEIMPTIRRLSKSPETVYIIIICKFWPIFGEERVKERWDEWKCFCWKKLDGKQQDVLESMWVMAHRDYFRPAEHFYWIAIGSGIQMRMKGSGTWLRCAYVLLCWGPSEIGCSVHNLIWHHPLSIWIGFLSFVIFE